MPPRGRVLLALLVGPLALLGLDCGQPTPDAPPPASAAEEETVAGSPAWDRAQRAAPLVGVVRSAVEVRIHSQVDGTATRVMVRDGDIVKAGDTLVLLANPELDGRAGQAAAAHASARARADGAGVDSRMNALERATSLSVAELEYQRAQVSTDITRHISTQIVENDQAKNMAFSLTDVERSRSSLDRARRRLTQARLRQEATEARGASVALRLAKTARERERMEELQSKNFASASSVEEAQLSHATAVTRSEEHKSDLAGRVEDVRSAQDEIESAQARLEIWQEALGHGVTSLQGMKASRQAMQTREEQVTAASGVRLEAASARVELDAARSDLSAAASLESARDAEAAAQVADQQVKWLRVVAPSDGVVVGLNVAAGELVRSARKGASAGEPLLTLADPAQLVARVPVNASDLEWVVVGQPVTVTLHATGDTPARGEVASVVPVPGSGSVYIATILLADASGIPIGSIVHVELP